jgi:hypothetical protein
VRNGRIPYAQSIAAPAQVLSHDVEAEEGEACAVIDAGDGRGRSAVELADQEAFRIDRGEAGIVGEAGFQPSGAAQFTAIEISSGRIVRMLRSFMAGDRTNGLMKPRLPPVSRYRQTIERYGAALSFRIFSSI